MLNTTHSFRCLEVTKDPFTDKMNEIVLMTLLKEFALQI